jgi:hypothetical protein
VTDPISVDWARSNFPDLLAYFIEHRDGFRTTLFMAPIHDFNYAGLRSDTDEIISCQMYLPMPGHSATTADFFHPLVRHIKPVALSRRAHAAHVRNDAGRGRFDSPRLQACEHAGDERRVQVA